MVVTGTNPGVFQRTIEGVSVTCNLQSITTAWTNRHSQSGEGCPRGGFNARCFPAGGGPDHPRRWPAFSRKELKAGQLRQYLDRGCARSLAVSLRSDDLRRRGDEQGRDVRKYETLAAPACRRERKTL